MAQNKKQKLNGGEDSPETSVPISEMSLGESCLMIVDCPHSTPVWTEFGFTVLRSHNIRNGRLDLSDRSFTDGLHFADRVRRAKPKKGDLVITREAPMGEVCMLPDGLECCLGQRMVLLRPDSEKIDSKYLLFSIQSEFVQRQIRWNEGTGSTVSNLRIPVLEALRIPFHSLSEQKIIAHILGSLDDKIENNRRMNETLEAMARALFKDWFVDFGPVRAKMEGREPPGLSAEVAGLFPGAMGGNEMPHGWSLSKIGDEVRVSGGGTPSTKEPKYWNGGGIHWVTPKDLSGLDSPVLLDSDRKITDDGLATISSGLLPKGTLLLSSRAPIGYLAIAEIPTAINQGFIAMLCDQFLSNLYVLFWCGASMDLILGSANGSTFQEISKSNFRPLPVIVPSGRVMDAFQKAALPLYEKIVGNLQEIQLLKAIRDGLLPKLLSGEIRIKDPEKFLGGF